MSNIDLTNNNPTVYLKTLCKNGHTSILEKMTISGFATFGSDSDFCLVCEEPIVSRLYSDSMSGKFTAPPEDKL